MQRPPVAPPLARHLTGGDGQPGLRRRTVVALAGLIAGGLAPATVLAQAATPAPPAADWDVPGGHFYTQGAPPEAPADWGFVVADEGGIPFWQLYQALGGPAQLGYPLSSRFDEGPHTYQAMQAGIVRWNDDGQYADLHTIYVALSELGLDDWLASHGVPAPAAALQGDPLLPADARLRWLSHPTLRAAYWEADDAGAERRFGLPMSEAQRFGPFLAQRFERATLQLWLDALPGQPAPGSVTVVQIGALLQQAGLIPEAALTPVPPPAPRPAPPAPRPTAPPAPAAPGGGKQILVSLGRQWWYAYLDRQPVNDGPCTTGRPELATPTGRFSVLSRHSPYTMYSPWPRGSPFYYEPSSMTYALRITGNGVYLHDAPWRPFYGPGTNVPHYDPDGVWRTGSHGCINLPFRAAAFLWDFAPLGTPVHVVA